MDKGLTDQGLEDPASAVISWPDVLTEATQVDFQDGFQAALRISGTDSSACTRLWAQLQDTPGSTGSTGLPSHELLNFPALIPTNLGHSYFKGSCEFFL